MLQMQPLSPKDLYSVLDLDRPDLNLVKRACDRGDREEAARELLAALRQNPPVSERDRGELLARPADDDEIERANNAARHVFQWGPYEAYDYGPDIDWDSDPRNDREWQARMHRMSGMWTEATARAYRTTGDERYAQTWVRLTEDWIRKFPVNEKHNAYRDIQVGVRASAWCCLIGAFIDSPAVTPAFLELFLASVYDQAQKMDRFPRVLQIDAEHKNNNKTLIEAGGLLDIALTFPQFKDAERWLQRSLELVADSLPYQVMPDGVQREYTPSYHIGCTGILLGMARAVQKRGGSVPSDFRETLEKMAEYTWAMTAPDGKWPMFGDSRRRPDQEGHGELLEEAAVLLGRPDLAPPDEGVAPRNIAFEESGMYFFRSGWDRDAVYLALHCSPPALRGGRKGGHDQPDNGTFELFAYGRWVMPDSGAFVYHGSSDPRVDRMWFRRTGVHQTLTVDGLDSVNASRHVMWWDGDDLAALTVENDSYPGLTHRRTVFFVDRRIVVLVDQALGTHPGKLDLHFQLAPGRAVVDPARRSAWTMEADQGNVLVWSGPREKTEMHEEEGYASFLYGKYEPRKAVRLRHAEPAPALYVSVLVPFKGEELPRDVGAQVDPAFSPGGNRLDLDLWVDGRRWRLGSDGRTAWAKER